MVEPTHLKNLCVKIDDYPKFRVSETTTQWFLANDSLLTSQWSASCKETTTLWNRWFQERISKLIEFWQVYSMLSKTLMLLICKVWVFPSFWATLPFHHLLHTQTLNGFTFECRLQRPASRKQSPILIYRKPWSFFWKAKNQLCSSLII